MRGGDYDDEKLNAQLDNRGLISRVVRRAGMPVERPWHMYVVGLLFGLGFDTATEIALLVVAGTGSASGLPWYAILCLPVLFAAGMSLLDTLDGTFMNFAYDWSLAQPVRKLYYNLTITGLSIAVALIVGSVELLGLLHDRLGLHHGPWSWAANVNVNTIGFLIVGLFLITWLVSLLVWRYARIEQRWSRPPRSNARPVRDVTRMTRPGTEPRPHPRKENHMSALTNVAPVVLEPAAQEFAEATASPPYLFDLGPAEGRKTVDEVQSGQIAKPEVDVQDTHRPGRPVRCGFRFGSCARRDPTASCQ